MKYERPTVSVPWDDVEDIICSSPITGEQNNKENSEEDYEGPWN